MYALGIETSCDETSSAVVYNKRVLSNVTVSSLRYHKKYGGVVPEIATRNHLKFIDKVLTLSLEKANVNWAKIGVIGVTYRPGLIGALVIGVNFAKSLSLALKKPLVGINHLYAHLFAPFLDRKIKIPFPFIGLVISGGHTELFFVEDFDCIKVLGKTRDDACGEVFDKVARVFGLGYPGGIYIDKIFSLKFKDSFKFRCPRIGFDFSFSGIKTALIYKKMELEKKGQLDKETKIKILSSFQETVVRTLVESAIEAGKRFKVKNIVCGGGVAANSRLRMMFKERVSRERLRLFLPSPEYTSDNAAMVAGLAFYLYNNKGEVSNLKLEARAN